MVSVCSNKYNKEASACAEKEIPINILQAGHLEKRYIIGSKDIGPEIKSFKVSQTWL